MSFTVCAEQKKVVDYLSQVPRSRRQNLDKRLIFVLSLCVSHSLSARLPAMMSTLFVVLLLVSAVAAEDDWIVVVDELYTEASLSCNMSSSPNGSEPYAWMLPDFTILMEDSFDGRILISGDLYELTVLNVTTDDFGLYHCMMETTDGLTYMNRLGINVKGPYFEDLWEKYETNVIIGVSAFGGFLVLALMTIAAWQNRWEISADALEIHKDLGVNDAYNGHTNFAMEMEDTKKPDEFNGHETTKAQADELFTKL
jgi:hypothetical protein